jgi:4-hydroxybenzoate polyprenyltransferase
VKVRAYLELMRFNKPIGILLLWWPTAWALWLSNKGHPNFSLIILFFIGTIFMRAAGCVMNDIADRHIDRHVKRTKERPLTTGKITLFEAFVSLFILLLGALIILLQLGEKCFYYAVVALLITFVYPFCKRFVQTPQLVLGLAFSMGIPMAFVASNQNFSLHTLLLWLINFLWIIAYDTEYAMVDREDDLRISVKSTAILFADYDKLILALLQILFHLLWLPLALHFGKIAFWFCWLMAIVNLVYQQILLHKCQPEDYFRAFLANNVYGFLMWLGIVLATV